MENVLLAGSQSFCHEESMQYCSNLVEIRNTCMKRFDECVTRAVEAERNQAMPEVCYHVMQAMCAWNDLLSHCESWASAMRVYRRFSVENTVQSDTVRLCE
jgi:hypothetical protein